MPTTRIPVLWRVLIALALSTSSFAASPNEAPTSSAEASRSADTGVGTGTIEGRVSIPATGIYIERARITVDGTSLATFTDSGGNYRLTNVPAGSVRLHAFYTGLGQQETEVSVVAGQTVQHDMAFVSAAAAPDGAGSPIKLEKFVVAASRDMSASARAINEQRFSPNLKNVISTDEFGDVAEGNVAEFLKFIPGVNIDGFGRRISINGVPEDYVPVTVNGFTQASAIGAGVGGTNRAVALDLFSINNLARIEVTFSPTPESQGMELGGSVNMVSRSAFERSKPVFNFSAFVLMRDDRRDFHKTPGPLRPTRKVHPGFDFSYVAPVNKRFGYTISAGYSLNYSGETLSQNSWRGNQLPTNGTTFPHTTFDRPYLSSYLVRDFAKETKRRSFAASIDYKPTPNDHVTLAVQASLFDVLVQFNQLGFNVNSVAPGAFSPSSTRGVAGAGDLVLSTLHSIRANGSYTPSIIWRHDGPVWEATAGAAYSSAVNKIKDFDSGLFTFTTARRRNVTVSFDDNYYLRPGVITVTDAAGAAVNPYSLDSYVLTDAVGNLRETSDVKQTLYANVKRDFYGRVPFSLKAGLDFRQATRDGRADLPAFAFVGRDGLPSTAPTGTSDDQAKPFLDPSYSARNWPFGFPSVEGIDSAKLHEFYLANPTQFTSNANTDYRAQVNNSKRTQELVSAAYVRGDLQFFENRLKLVGGVRVEQTNVEGEGPLNDPSRNNPVITTDPLQISKLTLIERGGRAEKEYLRWFPSLNASYNVRENLIARVAYSTSIGRPDFGQYSGGVSVPDPENRLPTDRISVNNVALKPWTARSVSARLEYYFQGVGQLSIGGFRREFENFFGSTVFRATPEFLALYDLDPAVYGDYDVITQHNIGSKVRMEGVTVNYKQALTFLPPWARGIQVFANGSAQRLTGPASANFPTFIPRSGSWGVSLSRERYSLRANWNYRGRQRNLPVVGTGIEPGTYLWSAKALLVDLNAEYYFYKRFAVYANLRNVADTTINDALVYGPSTPDQAKFISRIQTGSLWMVGIKGEF